MKNEPLTERKEQIHIAFTEICFNKPDVASALNLLKEKIEYVMPNSTKMEIQAVRILIDECFPVFSEEKKSNGEN